MSFCSTPNLEDYINLMHQFDADFLKCQILNHLAPSPRLTART